MATDQTSASHDPDLEGGRPQKSMTIGAVCKGLAQEFPDISISKIRYLEDQGSLNGTYVNRRRIESERLESGDEVQVGKYRLSFLVTS